MGNASNLAAVVAWGEFALGLVFGRSRAGSALTMKWQYWRMTRE